MSSTDEDGHKPEPDLLSPRPSSFHQKRAKLSLPEIPDPDKNGIGNGANSVLLGGTGTVTVTDSDHILDAEFDLAEELHDNKLVQEMGNCWRQNKSFKSEDGLIAISNDPFLHVEINNFTKNQEILEEFVQHAFSDKVVFQDKISDLFQFKQSYDLKSVACAGLSKLRDFFQTKVLDLIVSLTGLPLNGQVDMFLSDYRQTDHLLCHDDELESRRIAFILYLTKDWKVDYGGLLDLINSTDDIQPTAVSKSIVPDFNKFVFFNVTCKSFHQVSEVNQPEVKRLALSGWFLGEPLPRPKLFNVNTASLLLRETLCKADHCLINNYVGSTYADKSAYSTLNSHLEENSEVLLVDFLKEDIFLDASNDLSSLEWTTAGPSNLLSFFTTKEHFWPEPEARGGKQSTSISNLIEFFHSVEFLLFLEGLTEFPFTNVEQNTTVSSQLSKYKHKCYKLLKSNMAIDDETLESDEDEVEEEELAQFVDVIYFGGLFNWDDNFGGEVVYVDEDGEQLMTISPCPNSLAIIVRTKSVNSYVNYINCRAGENIYFSYTMTFSFT